MNKKLLPAARFATVDAVLLKLFTYKFIDVVLLLGNAAVAGTVIPNVKFTVAHPQTVLSIVVKGKPLTVKVPEPPVTELVIISKVKVTKRPVLV